MIRTLISKLPARRVAGCIAALALASWTGMGQAEDIELYSTKIDTPAERPNVMILMDNTANWSQSFDGSTKFAAEKNALAATFLRLDDRFNVGMMMYSETGGGNTGIDGGYVRSAIRNMNLANRTALSNLILSVDATADKSNGGKLGLSMYEVHQYFKGATPYAGTGKVKQDPAAGNPYVSPIGANGCAKNFLIVIGNGPVQDNNSDTTTSTNFLSGLGGNTTTIALSPSSSQDNISDEWARFLYGNDLNSSLKGKQCVTTFTVDVGPSNTGQGPGFSALLESMALQGKGLYIRADTIAKLNAALERIFNQIQSVNSQFASASLPVSVTTRGTYLNQVFMGVFRPDAFRSPRWQGNLKQYKLLFDSSNNLFLADSLNQKVENDVTGFVIPDAASFWTNKPGTDTGFWSFSPDGSGGKFDLPDGEFVEKGGAAQKLRQTYATSQTARKMYTCVSCTTTLENFDTANMLITDATLGGGLTASVTSLSRVGNVATATTAAAHGFTDGQNVVIAGANPVDYNGTFSLGLVNATTFFYTVAETPLTPASGLINVALPGAPISVVSITRVGSIATVTTSAVHGFTNGQMIIMTGATQSEYNGTYAITVVTPTTFSYSVVVGPTSPATLGASPAAKVGATTAVISTLTRSGTTALVRLSAGTPAGFTVGASVIISGVTTVGYSGTYVITGLGAACAGAGSPTARYFCFTMVETPASPATGTIQADGGGSTKAVTSITRVGALATATTSVNHGLTGIFSATISGANEAGYNGSKTATVTAPNKFTFTVTLGPVTPATGTITATSAAFDRNTLINWMRGADNYEDENGNGVATDVRSSIHGDVLHSRPLVVNYFNAGTMTDDVVVYYGSNDGAFHAVSGNKGGAALDGQELWSFVAKEFLPKLGRLITQDPAYGTTAPFTPRSYFFDGPIGFYTEDANKDGQLEKAYIYPTMRRGGRYIYAFNVTDKNVPVLMWKKGCPNPTGSAGCDAGYDAIGQTWSQPTAAKVPGNANPVLIFGGGYSTAADDVEPQVAATIGNRIYVVDAVTGAVLREFGAADSGGGTNRLISNSVIADIYPVDANADGTTDWIYAADTGGNVWRVDVSDPDKNKWKIWQIASTAGTGVDARKFLFAPSVVRGKDANGEFYAIIIGSGDREKPLDTYAANNVKNRVYMFKDRSIGLDGSALGGLAVIKDPAQDTGSPKMLYDILAGEATYGSNYATTDATKIANARGWVLKLENTGEKVIGTATTAAGFTAINSHTPRNNLDTECNNLGDARSYFINYITGVPPKGEERSTILTGGGFIPSPVFVVVDTNTATGGPLRPGAGILLGTRVKNPGGSSFDARYRTYWYEVKDE